MTCLKYTEIVRSKKIAENTSNITLLLYTPEYNCHIATLPGKVMAQYWVKGKQYEQSG